MAERDAGMIFIQLVVYLIESRLLYLSDRACNTWGGGGNPQSAALQILNFHSNSLTAFVQTMETKGFFQFEVS